MGSTRNTCGLGERSEPQRALSGVAERCLAKLQGDGPESPGVLRGGVERGLFAVARSAIQVYFSKGF